jgi:hypothetical protein
MAKIRREKDIISRTVDRYVKATTEDYVKYWEGSPTYITYYQLDDIASTQDTNLENVHSLTGPNTPNKYKKIEDVVVYNVDAYDINNQLEEQGLRSAITGEFIFLPDSLRPYPGDFFSFDYDGMREHIFRIDDVQFDRATAKKFYRVSFAIYPDAPTFSNINTNEYVMEYSNIGGQELTVVKKSAAVYADSLKKLVDGFITKYMKTFYDEDMDTFLYYEHDQTIGETIGFWSPYLQKFLHDNKVLTKYKRELLEEIYIADINERDFGSYYNELAYRNSIFRKLENDINNLSFEDSFMSVLENDVKNTRNLPFFHLNKIFKAVVPYNNTPTFYLNAFHYLYQKPTQSYFLNSTKKFKNSSELTSVSIGDRWFNKTTNILYTATVDNTWEGASMLILPTSEPDEPHLAGDMYFDVSQDKLFTFSQNYWNEGQMLPTIQPNFPSHDQQWFNEFSNRLYTFTGPQWDEGSLMLTIEPLAPVEGDRWFNEQENRLYTYIIDPEDELLFTWDNGVLIPTTIPENPLPGQKWFDELENLLYNFDQGFWDEGIVLPTEEPEGIPESGDQWFNERDNRLFTAMSGRWSGIKISTVQPAINTVIVEPYDIIYNYKEYFPIDVFRASVNYSTSEIDIHTVNFAQMIRTNYSFMKYIDFKPFIYMRSYLNSELEITEDIIKDMNNHYMEIDFKNYIFIPILIYILKRKIDEVYEN